MTLFTGRLDVYSITTSHDWAVFGVFLAVPKPLSIPSFFLIKIERNEPTILFNNKQQILLFKI